MKILIISTFFCINSASAQIVSVQGYNRNGKWVNSYSRSAPDSSKANNFGSSRDSSTYNSQYNWNTNPNTRDKDRDGIANMYDNDDDNDGILDEYDN